MSIHPQRVKSKKRGKRQCELKRRGISAEQIHQQAVSILESNLTLFRPPEAEYDKESILSVLLYAPAHGSS